MADANVLLRIGSAMGPGGLSSLEAGWNMLRGMVSTIIDVTERFDQMSSVVRRVDMEMVNYADSAAKGQIDTMALAKQLSMLNRAAPRLKLTADQFKIMAVRAADFAQATGAPGGATAVFERMTNGIARAESEALKPFGIKLKENADMMVTQTQAVKELTEGYEDLEFSLETVTERIYSLSNAAETSLILTWEALTTQGSSLDIVLESITGHVDDFNTSMVTFSESEKDYLFSLGGITDAFKMLGAEAFDALMRVNWIKDALGMDYYEPGTITTEEQVKVADKMSSTSVDIEQAAAERKAAAAAAPAAAARRRGRGSRGKKEVDAGPSGPSSSPFAVRQRREIRDTREGVDTAGEYAELQEEMLEKEERLLRLVQAEFATSANIAALKEEELLSMREKHVDQEAYLGLLQDEEYQQAQLAMLREDDRIYLAEREIYMAYEREQAIDFAHSFNRAWKQAFETVSAGANAARYAQNFLRQSWAAYVTDVVRGTGSLKEALKEVLIATGIRIAIEEGWLAVKDFAAAASAIARRQYVKGAQLFASGAQHTALAAVAGGAAGVASRIGASRGGGGAAGAASGAASSPVPSYGGGGYAGPDSGAGEVRHVFVLDDSASMFKLISEENSRQRRAGDSAFVEDDAA